MRWAAAAGAARLLVEADNPVIIADRLARTPDGMRLLVELAEMLNAPVIDLGSRENAHHPLPLPDASGPALDCRGPF